MRKIFVVAMLAVLSLSGTPASVAGERTVTLKVRDMTCALCPLTVRKALESVEGVTRARVSYRDETAVVTFDDGKADLAALTAATANAGYPSVPVQIPANEGKKEGETGTMHDQPHGETPMDKS